MAYQNADFIFKITILSRYLIRYHNRLSAAVILHTSVKNNQPFHCVLCSLLFMSEAVHSELF